jgi:hypothetical protein
MRKRSKDQVRQLLRISLSGINRVLIYSSISMGMGWICCISCHSAGVQVPIDPFVINGIRIIPTK